MTPRLDPLALLERPDKWYLGGGTATLFAPAFPRFLDTPGFWDEAYFVDMRLQRLFCVLLVDDGGHPIMPRRATRRWRPDRLTQIYTLEGRHGLRLTEERTVTPHDTLLSRLTFTNSSSEASRLHVIVWSLQPNLAAESRSSGASDVERDSEIVSFAHYLSPTAAAAAGAEPERHRLYVALGGSRLPESCLVNLAETTCSDPLWQSSVFPEKFRAGSLTGEIRPEAGWEPGGQLHLALHYVLEIDPGQTDALSVGASLAFTRETALDHLRADVAEDALAASTEAWRAYFDSVPYFECTDPYLERYYWYRWYGLRLMTVDARAAGAGSLPNPCVFEGIAGFRAHISYSAMCHMRETAWMRNPSVAMGSIENFLASQVDRRGAPDDGAIPGRLRLFAKGDRFYHADWGAAALHVYYLTGDLNFVRRIYPDLVRYAQYFDRVRDREGSCLYDVVDQMETGQEYSSRYLFVDPQADDWRPIRLKGVDATCYMYSLYRTLATFARLLLQTDEAVRWGDHADRIRNAVRDTMWDGEALIFKDAHPETLERSPSKAAVGFYPFMTDLATDRHVAALRAHLENPDTFATPYPVPSLSVDDPVFSAEAEWKGKRMNCPWNGRVWPMTNSHVAEALARAARTIAPDMASAAASFIKRFVHMMFTDNDPKRPNCFEHYNPNTGTPCTYRGVDDYQHSWVVDLIMKHLVGVQPEPKLGGKIVIEPLPFGLNSFRCEGIPIRGHVVDVIWNDGEGLFVRVDGVQKAHSQQLQRLEVLPDPPQQRPG
jgi:hypothetical protein